jgi:hypothetical protein
MIKETIGLVSADIVRIQCSQAMAPPFTYLGDISSLMQPLQPCLS